MGAVMRLQDAREFGVAEDLLPSEALPYSQTESALAALQTFVVYAEDRVPDVCRGTQ